jgi:hypothetical protein
MSKKSIWVRLVSGFSSCRGGLEYLHRSPASCRRQWKRNLLPAGITEPPYLPLRGLVLQVGGLEQSRSSYGKKNTVAKYKKVKAESNLVQSSKEGCGWKSAVLLMIADDDDAFWIRVFRRQRRWNTPARSRLNVVDNGFDGCCGPVDRCVRGNTHNDVTTFSKFLKNF